MICLHRDPVALAAVRLTLPGKKTGWRRVETWGA